MTTPHAARQLSYIARSATRPSRAWIGALALVLAGSCLAAPDAVRAAAVYPDRPIHMVVPFPAGGPADFVGRLYAQYLGKLTGQPVIIDNPAGAGGTIGTGTVARSEPNGYTILFGSTSTVVINDFVMKSLPYDYTKDFAQIGLIANAPHILAVRPGLPAHSVAELIALAKQSPGKYTFASAGIGTIVQMGGELFKQTAGIDILHVPYKGGNPATLALLTGEVDMTVNDMTTLKSHLQSGKLRALAVADKKRLALLPDTPTFSEQGLAIFSSTWWGVAVPVKTPVAALDKLKSLHGQIITDPTFVAHLADMAVEPMNLTPEQATAFIAGESRKWKTVAQKADVELQ